MPTFPTDTSALTETEAADKFLVSDNSDSDNAKDIAATNVMTVVNAPDSTAEGYTVAIGDDATHGRVGDVHSSTLIGGGTENDPNWIAVNDTHPTHGATGYDPAGSGHTIANHSTVIGTYDQVNNQQATVLSSPHAYAPATTTSGHNAGIGGSWHLIDGEYNFLGGGGGSQALQNESESTANKCAIIGGDSNTVGGSHSAVLAGKSNTVGAGHSYCTVAGFDAMTPFSYSQVYGMPNFISSGDACHVRVMFQDSFASTSAAWMQVGGSNLVFRDIPFNTGNPIGISWIGKITVMGVGVSGTNEGKMARYEQDLALYTTGTQGSTSWSSVWQDSSTGSDGPTMTRTDSGANQLPMTSAPYLQCNSLGIFRVGYQQNTTDTVHWLAMMDVLQTVWAT